MSTLTTLRLDHLFLHNFRCFGECSVELHPKLTVLVAENGRGKTAVLDAIGIALGLFVDTIAGTRQLHGFDRTDVRVVQGDGGVMRPTLPTEFVADGYVVGQPIRWSRALKKYSLRARTTTVQAEDFRQAALQLRETVQGAAKERDSDLTILPLVAFYGTGRLWSEHRLTEGKRRYEEDAGGRMSGYTDCLSPSSSFKGVVAWYENKINETSDPRFSTELAKNLALLSAVQEATRVVLEPTGWRALSWNFDGKSLEVEHPDYGHLPLSSLSDGVRNMIALVADIAHRCARLNPHLGEEAARRTPGVLLIDEVDMHLHPVWQQTVIDLLRKAFPSLQMVLSTHSPHVLSTVDMASIRIIRLRGGLGLLETPKFQTRGVESADVLAAIMGVDPIPPVIEAQWVRDFQALIQENLFETPDAEALRAQLEGHFGSHHPVLLECDRLIRLQRFKKTLPSSPAPKRD
jgi:predicted ATP-binding protein involved in virulence